MKLKAHRNDVKYLNLMLDEHAQVIARRYLNLIRMAEQTLPRKNEPDYQKFKWVGEPLKRVLKDTKV